MHATTFRPRCSIRKNLWISPTGSSPRIPTIGQAPGVSWNCWRTLRMAKICRFQTLSSREGTTIAVCSMPSAARRCTGHQRGLAAAALCHVAQNRRPQQGRLLMCSWSKGRTCGTWRKRLGDQNVAHTGTTLRAPYIPSRGTLPTKANRRRTSGHLRKYRSQTERGRTSVVSTLVAVARRRRRCVHGRRHRDHRRSRRSSNTPRSLPPRLLGRTRGNRSAARLCTTSTRARRHARASVSVHRRPRQPVVRVRTTVAEDRVHGGQGNNNKRRISLLLGTVLLGRRPKSLRRRARRGVLRGLLLGARSRRHGASHRGLRPQVRGQK
mmetsp:Transcript_98408/g.278295  ORF Transcript_98408/g.278295 Transcript_98408/m.278295 type:complete len:324 (+) Transcript_98408:1193-2164(+)